MEFFQPDPGMADKLYDEWVAKEQTKKAPNSCSCVQFVKRLTGFMGSVGEAKNWPINSKEPIVGGVVLLDEGPVGHIAYITSVNDDSFTISESNYVPCQKGTRTLNINDKRIIGYWEKVIL